MKALILYSELAGYFYHCLQTLIQQGEINELLVVTQRASVLAPYEFDKTAGISIIYWEGRLSEEIEAIAYSYPADVVYLSGWWNKQYLKIGRVFKRQGIPVVMGLDNQWSGSFRQQLACFVFPFLYRRSASHIWVAGIYQYEFARRLGYSKQYILFNLYSANIDLFEKDLPQKLEKKKRNYPKIILFIGRFVPDKGLNLLLEAFNDLTTGQNTEWQLWMVGNGPLKSIIQQNPAIRLLDFVQPEELPELMHACGVFCLPSRRENWGVVLHEAAAAGLPILASDACGAATAFVKHRYNGYVFASGKQHSLKKYLQKLMGLSDERLLQMARYSAECAKQITPQIWAATFTSVIKR